MIFLLFSKIFSIEIVQPTVVKSFDPTASDQKLFEDLLSVQVKRINEDIAVNNETKSDNEFLDDTENARDNALKAYNATLLDPAASPEEIIDAGNALKDYDIADEEFKAAKRAEMDAMSKKQEADSYMAKFLSEV